MSESAERKEKFTPGPWSKAHLNEKGCRCGYVFSEGGETIAKILYNDKEDANYCRYEEDLPLKTARANAALIAAAPDMYAALEELLACHDEDIDMDEFPDSDSVGSESDPDGGNIRDMPLTFGTLRRARGAISKARGES